MSTHRPTSLIPLARPWPRRLLSATVAAVHAAWQDWQGWRRQRHAAAQVCSMGARVLDDLGAPADWHAAAAQCRAHAEMERRLLRAGSVPGLGW